MAPEKTKIKTPKKIILKRYVFDKAGSGVTEYDTIKELKYVFPKKNCPEILKSKDVKIVILPKELLLYSRGKY